LNHRNTRWIYSQLQFLLFLDIVLQFQGLSCNSLEISLLQHHRFIV
jgi:hypothetical protein